ncbi:MAG: neutral zinc metallopeptidase [Pseudomonadota bacterium]
MRWRGRRTSSNIEDRRTGRGARRVGGVGGIGAILVVLASLFFPEAVPVLRMLGLDGAGGGLVQGPVQTLDEPRRDDQTQFVSVVLADTETIWSEIFATGAFERAGNRYDPAVLVLFEGGTTSPCGNASAQSGPFYCPADGKIYIDPAFYEVMATKLKAPGDFAQAYVIAHEVAHHVQNLNGVLPAVQRRRASLSSVEGNRLTVRVELQADCYSGVWARRIEERERVLEEGDLNEALRAAYSVGDDILMRMSGRRVDETKFTHGTAEQRARWFKIGLQSGDIRACDTFSQPYQQL